MLLGACWIWRQALALAQQLDKAAAESQCSAWHMTKSIALQPLLLADLFRQLVPVVLSELRYVNTTATMCKCSQQATLAQVLPALAMHE